MAHMSVATSVNVMKIKEFLGLNENPDGDTHIRDGELSEMRNFRITRDRHLQVRPGQKTMLNLRASWDAWAETQTEAPEITAPRFCGAWEGTIGSRQRVIVAFGGVLFDVNPEGWTTRVIGTCTEDDTSFFGFGDKVYLLNGHEYMSWDGGAQTSFAAVEGYIPNTYTAMTPSGRGTALENVNRLTGKRKVKFSPDGSSSAFHLPEQDISEVVKVEGTNINYAVSLSAGTVTFTSPPTAGTNTLSVTYRKGDGTREQITGMRFAELYNGATDTRVFLYGDGSNKTYYSGVELDTGVPTAEYFPDLYEAAVGESNTPITAMIRHYARLLVFKPESAWSVDYSVTTTALGTLTSAFYVTPVNRSVGNRAPGQVLLMENNPVTMDICIYQWKATSSGGNITSDNRNASRISDRISSTISGFDLTKTVAFNRRTENEFWFLCEGKAAILNYANDAWYVYTNMPFRAMVDLDGQIYGFTPEGDIRHVSRQYRSDDGEEIDAYAATGSMDFGRDWQLKYSPQIFVALQPENNARIYVSVETNRRSIGTEKMVASGLANFTHVDFAHFSFNTNRKPKVKRVKMKVKKATFYKLVFKIRSTSATATILETDVQLRYTGNVK